MKKLMIMMSCVMILAGCQGQNDSSSDNKTGYEDMNGMETYVAAIEFFNKNVQYYQTDIEEGGITTTEELYKVDDLCGVVTKALYQEGDYSDLSYTITCGNEFHTLFLGEDGYQYEYVDDYSEEKKLMYTDLSLDNSYEIEEVTRVDQDNKIVLSLKLKQSVQYQQDDDMVTNYLIKEIIIGEDQYIVSEKDVYYEDDTYSTVLQEGEILTISNINQKGTDDFDKEIELMKSCEGLGNEEVIDQLGL